MVPFRDTCGKCGARRVDRQLGLEPSPREYVARLVEIFEEVKRVLRDDGTLWLNLGDSYASDSCLGRKDAARLAAGLGGGNGRGTTVEYQGRARRVPDGLKPKDLLGIPWMVAFALRDAGWYLRSEIIWAKPNPMPESVTDRPTKAHEQVFLLSKRPTYYYDAEAVREPHQTADDPRNRADYEPQRGAFVGGGVNDGRTRTVGASTWPEGGRNRRSVWTVAPAPFPEAHFATFPPALVEPMVRAGTSERGCCSKCGVPWRRVVEREKGQTTERPKAKAGAEGPAGTNGTRGSTLSISGYGPEAWAEHGSKVVTVGWQPSCKCDAGDPVPAVILDPFAGAGTTLLVARRLGRHALGIELSPAYAAMARKRIYEDNPLFNATEQP